MSLSKWAALGVILAAAVWAVARERRPSCESGACLAPVAPLASPLPPAPHALRPVELGRRF